MRKFLFSIVLASVCLLPTTAFAETSGVLDNTGSESDNTVTTDDNTTCTTDNNTDVNVDNSNDQGADSGDTTTDGNTSAGGSQTGDATNNTDTNVDVTIDNGDACTPATTTEQPSSSSTNTGTTPAVLGASTAASVAVLPYTGNTANVTDLGIAFVFAGVVLYGYTLLPVTVRKNAAAWSNPCA